MSSSTSVVPEQRLLAVTASDPSDRPTGVLLHAGGAVVRGCSGAARIGLWEPGGWSAVVSDAQLALLIAV